MAGINDPGEIARALKTARTIAVVGCSPKDNRPSHAIASYLLSAGFDVIPVNPGHTEILGRTCYPDLASIPKDVRLDIVDVFRRSEFVPEIADAAPRARGGILLDAGRRRGRGVRPAASRPRASPWPWTAASTATMPLFDGMSL